MFYSKSTGGFYEPAIHGDSIPADAVEISNALYSELLTGQSLGRRIVADENGRPVLSKLPEVTLSDLKAAKNTAINNARLVANRGTFLHAGKAFACDELSRSDIDGANGYVAIHGDLPDGWLGAWKADDNSYLPIADVAAWKDFYTSMVIAGSANFARAQELKQALADATTAAEVAAITW